MEYKILIELDALLDTRIGTMALIDNEAATKMLSTDYTARLQDHFGHFSTTVTDEAFREAYEKRDVDTLKVSRLTRMGEYLREMTIDIEKKIINEPVYESVVVIIDTGHYDLTPEQRFYFEEAVKQFVGPLTEVRSDRVGTIGLLPHGLESRFDVVIIYHFHEWYEYHLNALAKTKCPRVTIICPALASHKKEIKPEDFKDEQGNIVNPFEATRVMLAEFIGVRMIEPKEFSIYMG